MVEKQPDALRLAERLEDPVNAKLHLAPYIAAELRRLHAENVDYGATIDHLTRENAEQIGEIVALKEQRDGLLEALEHVEGLAMADDWRDLPEIVRIARAAIAKATGETK